MEDYIDVLLRDICEERLTSVSPEYYTRFEQSKRALNALMEALTEQQWKLFLAYEETRNAAASISEDAYARRAFLLAREIFR